MNLRAAICRSDRYDPIFDRVFDKYSRHRGFVIDPAPVVEHISVGDRQRRRLWVAIQFV